MSRLNYGFISFIERVDDRTYARLPILTTEEASERLNDAWLDVPDLRMQRDTIQWISSKPINGNTGWYTGGRLTVVEFSAVG